MALPQTEEELQSLLDVMKQKNASSPEMKVVIDDFFDRKKLEGATPKAPEPPSLGEAVLGPAGVGLDVGKRTVEAAKGGVETLKSIKDKPVASGERFRKLISGGSDVFFAPLTGLMGEGIERAGLEEEASKLMEGVQTKATEVIDDFLVKRGLDPSSPQSIEAKKQLGLVPDLLLDAVGLGAAGKVAKAASKIDNIKLIDDAVAAVDELGEIKKSFSAKRADKAIQKEVTTRLKELQQIEDANGPVRKVIRQAEEKGIDVKQILTETDLLRGSVGPDGIMRTAQKGGAIDQLNDFIKPYENVISRILKQEGVTIDIDDIEAALLAKIEASDLKGANKLSARAKVQKELDGLSLDADEAGLITLLDVHKGKTDKYSTINYANPDTAKIDKLIARTYKELVEQNTKSIDVKNVNKELQTYFTVQDVLEKLDGRRLKGGKLGGYAADIVGAGVGAALAGAAGPLGVAAGAIGGREAARLIRGNIMKSKFSKGTGKMPEASDALKEASSSFPKGASPQKTLQTLKGSGKTVLIDSDAMKPLIPGYDPKKAFEVHDQSSRMAKELYEEALKDPSLENVTFTAGGSGSGKSEVFVSKNMDRPDTIIFDGTLADSAKARDKISKAKEAGKNVKIQAVYAPIEDAYKFAKGRERAVPDDVFIEKHSGFRETVYNLAKEDPDLEVSVLLNRDGLPPVEVQFKSRKDLLKYLEGQVLSPDEVKKIISGQSA